MYAQLILVCEAAASVSQLLLNNEAFAFLLHGRLPMAKKIESFTRWLGIQGATDPRAIVATAPSGCGVDVLIVRAVVYVETPPTLVQFLQESERARRDGERAASILFIPSCNVSPFSQFSRSERTDTSFVPDSEEASTRTHPELQKHFEPYICGSSIR